jgi:hypothetical protein
MSLLSISHCHTQLEHAMLYDKIRLKNNVKYCGSEQSNMWESKQLKFSVMFSPSDFKQNIAVDFL